MILFIEESKENFTHFRPKSEAWNGDELQELLICCKVRQYVKCKLLRCPTCIQKHSFNAYYIVITK